MRKIGRENGPPSLHPPFAPARSNFPERIYVPRVRNTPCPGAVRGASPALYLSYLLGAPQSYLTSSTALLAFLVDSPGAWEAPCKRTSCLEHHRSGFTPPPPAPTLSSPPRPLSFPPPSAVCVVGRTSRCAWAGGPSSALAASKAHVARPLRFATPPPLPPSSPARRLRLTLHLCAHPGGGPRGILPSGVRA